MFLNKTTLKVCLILESKSNVLLLEQTTENGGRYSLIGGKVEKEEFVTESLIREGLEEAGIVLREQDLYLAHVLHVHKGKKRQMVLYFGARQWTGEVASGELKKFKAAAWFSLNDLPSNMSEMTRSVLENHRNGVSFTYATVRTEVEMKRLERNPTTILMAVTLF